MTFLPPDNTGRRDRGKEEDSRRQRARFARDIGDEHGLAFQHEKRTKRSKFTIGTASIFIAFAVLGALPLILHKGSGGLLEANCTTPSIESGPNRIKGGTNFSWQAAGPETGPYVIALNADSVTGPATGPVAVSGGRLLTGPTAFQGCRTTQTIAKGPDAKGSYEVALFRHSGTGWDRIAVSLLNVS